jgi:hypothetical protein
MIGWWNALLTRWFGSHLHGHQVNALIALSRAMAHAGCCRGSAVALCLGGRATVASGVRRVERFLANPRLDVARLMTPLRRGLLATHAAPAGRLLLVLDETPLSDRLRAMTVRLIVHGRAYPLAWQCYPANQPPPVPMPRLIRRLLCQVARDLPENADITLLTDRGLTWPRVIDLAARLRWHFVGRVQGQTAVRLPDGTRQSIADLCPHPGDRHLGVAVQAFAAAGWRTMNVICVWQPDAAAPWLLVSDLAPGMRRCIDYSRRMRAEESFRDDKTSGLQWQRSQVRDPAHAMRLLTLMALAMILCIQLGVRLLRHGRRPLDPHHRRRLSVFQLGLRHLQYTLNTAAYLPP